MAKAVFTSIKTNTRSADFAIGFAWQVNEAPYLIGNRATYQVTAGSALGLIKAKNPAAFSLFKSISDARSEDLLSELVLALWADGTYFYAHELGPAGPMTEDEQILDDADSVQNLLRTTRAKIVICNMAAFDLAQEHFGGHVHVIDAAAVLDAAQGPLTKRHKFTLQGVGFASAALAVIIAAGWGAATQFERDDVVELKALVAPSVYSWQNTTEFVRVCADVVGYAGPRIYGKTLTEVGCSANGLSTPIGASGPIAWQRSAQDPDRNSIISERLWTDLKAAWPHKAVNVDQSVYTAITLTAPDIEQPHRPNISAIDISEFARSRFFGTLAATSPAPVKDGAPVGALSLTLEANIHDVLSRLEGVDTVDVISVSQTTGAEKTTLILAPKYINER